MKKLFAAFKKSFTCVAPAIVTKESNEQFVHMIFCKYAVHQCASKRADFLTALIVQHKEFTAKKKGLSEGCLFTTEYSSSSEDHI